MIKSRTLLHKSSPTNELEFNHIKIMEDQFVLLVGGSGGIGQASADLFAKAYVKEAE